MIDRRKADGLSQVGMTDGRADEYSQLPSKAHIFPLLIPVPSGPAGGEGTDWDISF